jgi:phenylpropionate dioxygenase-like ring-hydroxylating dioxygenase large terminal subunit
MDLDTLVKPDAVHGDVYTDPRVFAEEMKRIYETGWVYVGHASEVATPGEFKLSRIGTKPVIMARDERGHVHVLFNRCRHRAATVCQVECGNADGFRCEYHGWRYQLDGTLASVPYADAYENLDTAALSLARPPRVYTYRGFVFASLVEDGPALEEHLGAPACRQIDYFCDLSPEGEILVEAGASKLAYDGNWKLQMENSIDGYHPNFTHQSFLGAIQRATGRRVDLFDGDSAAECRALGMGHTCLDYGRYNLDHPARGVRLDDLRSTSWGKKYYDDMVTAHGEARAQEVIAVGGTHMSIFPNLVVLGQQVRTIRPIRHDRTEVLLAPALLKGAPDELNTQRLRQYESFYSPAGGGIHDDIEMFLRVTEGLKCSAEPWLLFKRGLARERQDEDGTIVGQVTDEVSQRAMYRHWKSVMAEANAS